MEILYLVQQLLKFREGMVVYQFNNMMEAVDNLQKLSLTLKFLCALLLLCDSKCVQYFSHFNSWKILAHLLPRIVNLIFVKIYTVVFIVYIQYVILKYFLQNVKKAILSIIFIFTVVRMNKSSSSLTGVLLQYFQRDSFIRYNSLSQ